MNRLFTVLTLLLGSLALSGQVRADDLPPNGETAAPAAEAPAGGTEASGGATGSGPQLTSPAANSPFGADPNLPPVVEQPGKDQKGGNNQDNPLPKMSDDQLEGKPMIQGFCPTGTCFRQALGGSGGMDPICAGSNVKGASPGQETCIGSGAAASLNRINPALGGDNTQ